jgi:hypothetical protein
MVNNNFYRLTKIVVGLIIGSFLSASWFHFFGVISDFLHSQSVQAELDFGQIVIKHAAFIFYFSVISISIMIVIGLPLFFIGKKINKASWVNAVIFGGLVGLSVTFLYGGPQFNSLEDILSLIGNFVCPGVIAGYSLWYFGR